MCVSSLKMYNTPLVFNKDEIDDSLIDYNPIHFTMIDFDYLHLVHNLNNTNDDYKYIIGSIISLMGTAYFVYNIVITIFKK